MKKMVIILTAMMTMVVSITTFASVQKEQINEHNHECVTTHIDMQGTHCRGTVGCGCPGFSPITNGDVWQQAYCRHCGHHRSYHR